MNWLTDWQTISVRIKSCLNGASFFYSSRDGTLTKDDNCSVNKKVLLPSAKIIFETLKEFSKKYEHELPETAQKCLKSFLNQPEINEQSFFNPSREFEHAHVQFALTSLATFQSEFSYIIADTEFIARRLTERAFIHLQRSIVVDEAMREKWKIAFEKRETKCEQLGAVHLLLHGVWAFKVDASGGRTDLILVENEPLSSAANAANALVLTEWKLVEIQSELSSKIEQARRQAEIYSAAMLAGVELRKYRYLVMVSEKRMEMPPDTTQADVTYRHINIAVDPDIPSVEARKNARQK